ncbi:TPA: protein jag [Streptococcus agalactiae]|nr:protein jag [Streptococcus agalactiae]
MVLFTGATVEEAIEKGLQELNISRLRAHIKVVSREKKGFLGFGKKPAKVEIEGITDEVTDINESVALKNIKNVPSSVDVVEEYIEEVDETLEKEDVSQPELPKIDDKNVVTTSEAIEKIDLLPNIEVAAAQVTKYVENIIYEMDLDATIETTTSKRQINLQIETPESGRIIGYHGKVLKSLQLLAQNYLHDRFSKSFSVSINVHDYVEHRTETLIDFSKKIARRVLETNEPYHMDPMSNSERKTVHKTIATIEGVESYSEGNDPNRFVVVTKK